MWIIIAIIWAIIKVLNLAEQEKTETLKTSQMNYTVIFFINLKPLGNLQ